MLKHARAEVNGIELHYVHSGEGQLLLFLHGFPEFWYAWKRQLEEFGTAYHAVAPDLRGYNLSAKPASVDAYAPMTIVEDIRGLVTHLGHTRAIVAGHDWGGVIAWLLAMTPPKVVEKLVIINAPHPVIFARELAQDPQQRRASEYMNLFRSAQAEEILSANDFSVLRRRVFETAAAPDAFSPEDRQEYLTAWSQPGALTGGLNYYRASAVGPHAEGDAPNDLLTQSLRTLKVQVPTLVIWGEKDAALLTGNLDGLEQVVSNLRIKRIATGTHWVIHEQPETINECMREFISGH